MKTLKPEKTMKKRRQNMSCCEQMTSKSMSVCLFSFRIEIKHANICLNQRVRRLIVVFRMGRVTGDAWKTITQDFHAHRSSWFYIHKSHERNERKWRQKCTEKKYSTKNEQLDTDLKQLAGNVVCLDKNDMLIMFKEMWCRKFSTNRNNNQKMSTANAEYCSGWCFCCCCDWIQLELFR